MEKVCLNCKYFRLEDMFSGRCRIDKDQIERDRLPVMKIEDSCSKWKDAGQQYHIRAGWIKSMKKKQAEAEGEQHH